MPSSDISGLNQTCGSYFGQVLTLLRGNLGRGEAVLEMAVQSRTPIFPWLWYASGINLPTQCGFSGLLFTSAQSAAELGNGTVTSRHTDRPYGISIHHSRNLFFPSLPPLSYQ
jgi:hypothetical protein